MFLQVEFLTVRAKDWIVCGYKEAGLMVPTVLLQRSCIAHGFAGGVFDCEGGRVGGAGQRQPGGEERQVEVEGCPL